MFHSNLSKTKFSPLALFAVSLFLWSNFSFGISYLQISDLKLVKNIGVRSAIYQDKAGSELYVRYVGDPDDEGDAGGTLFESIADVVASHIYAVLVEEEIYIKRLIVSQEGNGQQQIVGVASRQPKSENFHPLWGPRYNPPQVLNLERNVVIWDLLGMSAADVGKIGFDSNGNLTRVDFDVAFTQKNSSLSNKICIKTQLGSFKKYPCNLLLIQDYQKTLLIQRGQILSLVNQYVETFKQNPNVLKSLKRIETFLNDRLRHFKK